ncbi:hypothetical protein AAF712_015000 [Marasmius tenuissimus]|uniref:Uncharacterized protein n=1 Tax=Marasmius tenuissimus TaxID=585030 RepID=A0ABR2ZCY6_9AGAR
MVRPRKYKTKVEQRRAALEKSRRSYHKHKDEILARRETKRKEDRARQDRELVKNLLGSMHRRSKDDFGRNEEKRAQSYFESLLDVYHAELSKSFTPNPLDFYESLYQRTVWWLDQGSPGTSPFSKLESHIQQLNCTVTLHKDKVYNLFGDNKLYKRYSTFLELVKEHSTCIDELEYGRLVDGLVSEEQLHEKHNNRGCAYQNPSRVPLLSGVKDLM